jgi:hypothetical protein
MAGAMSLSLPFEIAGHEEVTSLVKKVGQMSFCRQWRSALV